MGHNRLPRGPGVPVTSDAEDTGGCVIGWHVLFKGNQTSSGEPGTLNPKPQTPKHPRILSRKLPSIHPKEVYFSVSGRAKGKYQALWQTPKSSPTNKAYIYRRKFKSTDLFEERQGLGFSKPQTPNPELKTPKHPSERTSVSPKSKTE
jgi:hypothetical protein